MNNGLTSHSRKLLYAPLVGAGGFEPPELRSQSPLPYRLATPQYTTVRAKPYHLKDTQRRNTVGWFALPSPLPRLTFKDRELPERATELFTLAPVSSVASVCKIIDKELSVYNCQEPCRTHESQSSDFMNHDVRFISFYGRNNARKLTTEAESPPSKNLVRNARLIKTSDVDADKHFSFLIVSEAEQRQLFGKPQLFDELLAEIS